MRQDLGMQYLESAAGVLYERLDGALHKPWCPV